MIAFETILQMGTEALPIVTTAFFIRRLSKPYLMVVLQVCIAFVVECIGYNLRINLHPNVWLYNCYLLMDCTIMLYAGFLLMGKRNAGHILCGYGFFLSCWVFEILKRPLNTFFTYTFIINAILLTAVYLIVLYKTAMAHKGPIGTLPEFWLSLGIMIYYACNLPYFSVITSLYEKCSRQAGNPLFFSLITSNNIRYIFITVSLILFATKLKETNKISRGR